MIITNLIATNVKRLKAINITPDGSMVVVGGQNEQGKSSTLDSIMYAIGGGRTICETPVRTGEDEAEIVIELGDLVVTKTIKSTGHQYLTITDKGKKVSSPQALLDSLTGTLSFDPLEFAGMKPKDQLNVLKNLVGIDLDTLDSKRTTLFDERTVVGRIRDQYEASLATMPVPTSTNTDKINVKDILTEIENANAFNNNVDIMTRRKAALVADNVRITEEIARLTELKNKNDIEINSFSDIETKIDITDLNTKLTNAMDFNNSIDRDKQYNDIAALAAAKREEYSKLTASIKEIDQEKETLLASAKFPIDDLSFGDNGVLYKGTPFSQASSAARLRTSVAIGLAMNPELKVLLIRDGSLLDEENLAMVAQMAEEAGAQVWIERVGKGDEVSVVIEDGLVSEDRTGISRSVTEETKKAPKQRRKKADTVVLDEEATVDTFPSDAVIYTEKVKVLDLTNEVVNNEDIIEIIDDTPEPELTGNIILDEMDGLEEIITEVDPEILRAEEMINNVLEEYMEDTIDDIKLISEKDSLAKKEEETNTDADITFGGIIEEVVLGAPMEEAIAAVEALNTSTVKEAVEELVKFEPRKIVIPETDGIAIVNVPNGKRSIIDDEIDYDNTY